ncbi:Predicted arabinose efflux permease, MFS family [Sulfobacillus thermosulfidooxidans DSM 9293]|uniref:Predicted arabinose efflux permease, MFS family n=1 Tax=Sulfobacillus thermosulfidooxidans (strain DSM 9293 / VKM B-1269 / AT-1) TaxID=929705 RepID=A0A1W1WKK5_SULTA|nr:MFS transporter [Sulfobacillus thermosulfidooxidans]SMC06817.1 Predicted arabinose efflux permease, MFS family [Sulfobacillus thermosulfidooxidans DSM 9293]
MSLSGLVLVMAVATGASVANLYYNQPLLALMARTFHVGPAAIGVVTMLTQIGYATGLLLFVPLADLWERKKLIAALFGLTAMTLEIVSVLPQFSAFLIANFALGAVTVVPQVIVPVAADLAPDSQRGRVVGIVMSGLLVGVLSARMISGVIGDWLGWQAVYRFAGILMVLFVIIVISIFPISRPRSRPLSYGQLLYSLGPIIRSEPELVKASLTGGALFGTFSAFWTTLTFRLSTTPYHYTASVIGLFGLLGIAGASVAPIAGRLADKRDPRVTITGAIVLVSVAWLLMWPLSSHLWALIVGIILLDLGVQAGQISNQSRIYALRPDARARVNTVYMVTYFLGGSIGSGIASLAWAHAQWTGVTFTALGLLSVAIITHLASLRQLPLMKSV